MLDLHLGEGDMSCINSFFDISWTGSRSDHVRKRMHCHLSRLSQSGDRAETREEEISLWLQLQGEGREEEEHFIPQL